MEPLEPDRLLSVYHAADFRFQRTAENNAVWAFYLERAPDGIGEHLGDLEDLAEEVAAGVADSDEFHEEMNEVADAMDEEEYAAATRELVAFQDGLRRRALGLPHDLGAVESFAADVGRDALKIASDVSPDGPDGS